MLVYEQGTNVAVDTETRLNPLTKRPFGILPKSVHEMYSCKLMYCTFAGHTAVTVVRRKVVAFCRRPTMSESQPLHEVKLPT